jgi:hypothetical protein
MSITQTGTVAASNHKGLKKNYHKLLWNMTNDQRGKNKQTEIA